MPLEILHRVFVFFGSGAGFEGAEIAATASPRVDLARIEAVAARCELADHRRLAGAMRTGACALTGTIAMGSPRVRGSRRNWTHAELHGRTSAARRMVVVPAMDDVESRLRGWVEAINCGRSEF
jgi:hypothetical protein